MTVRLSDMKTLRQYIETNIKIPLSILMTQDNVIPLDDTIDKAYLFGSLTAKETLYLSQADMDDFLDSCPQGYFMTGHWGHGINSYAVYYVRADAWSKVFLRLNYGGIYSSDDITARRVHDFLINYFEFENAIRERTKSLIFVDSMYQGFVKIDFQSGRSFEMHQSLFKNPKLWKHVQIKAKANGNR